MRSNPAHQLFLILKRDNILRSNLNFSTSYGRSTDWTSFWELLLVSFIWVGEKISLKYLLISGGDICPSMSRPCRHRLCSNWLKLRWRKSNRYTSITSKKLSLRVILILNWFEKINIWWHFSSRYAGFECDCDSAQGSTSSYIGTRCEMKGKSAI